MMETQTTFYGPRLREARQARALKANALSELIDVSPSSISQYESGKQIPSPYVIAKLSNVLNLPAHFFTDPPEPPMSNCLRWRSQSAATKAARERSEQKYEWFRRVIRFIERHVDFPRSSFFDIGMPNDPLKITHDDIEHAAEQVRCAWGLKNGPISHTVQLVENNGGIIVRSEMGDDCLDSFSDFDTASGRCYIILGTDKDSAVRSRHDVGHELAHVFLHRSVQMSVARQSAVHKEMEAQADRFASALLMPSTSFPLEVFSFSLDGLLHLKRRWGVSISSMIMRLHDLDLIDDAKKQSLFIQLSRRRWRRREPLDNEIVSEQPKLLRRSIDALMSEGMLDTEQVVLDTHLPMLEIERLLGLEARYMSGKQGDGEAPFELRLSN